MADVASSSLAGSTINIRVCGEMVSSRSPKPLLRVRILPDVQFAFVAQLVEHRTCNAGVVGSTPIEGSKMMV